MKRTPSLLFLTALAAALAGQTPGQIESWLKATDATRNAFGEAVISARASEVVEGKVTVTADFEIYTKGENRGLIVFRGGKNSGRKILSAGGRMWLIVPGASRPLPISANQRLMGGASIGDVSRVRFSEDYTASARPGTEEVEGRACRVLDLAAKSSRAPYPRVVLWFDEAERLPRRLLFSLPSGKRAKEVTFTKFRRAAGRTMVSEMEIRDLLTAGSKTLTRLEYLDYRPAKLADAIFTPEGARGL